MSETINAKDCQHLIDAAYDKAVLDVCSTFTKAVQAIRADDATINKDPAIMMIESAANQVLEAETFRRNELKAAGQELHGQAPIEFEEGQGL